MNMIEKAYAKLNLSLDCISKREDGYHELKSAVVVLDFHDTLVISTLSKNTPDDFVTCDDYSLRISKANLVHKVIDICRERWGFSEHFRVQIHKNIYIQAGLGGGSADAAAMFRGLIKILKKEVSDEEIKEICDLIGSDVYFQFYNKAGIVKGKGDIIEPFEHDSTFYCLLVRPHNGNSTLEIFKESDKFDLVHGNIEEVVEAFKNKDLKKLQDVSFNSLYDVAVSKTPQIKEIKDKLVEFGFECVGMTGSGSALYALSNNKKEMHKASKYFYHLGLQTDICKIFPSPIDKK